MAADMKSPNKLKNKVFFGLHSRILKTTFLQGKDWTEIQNSKFNFLTKTKQPECQFYQNYECFIAGKISKFNLFFKNKNIHKQ